MHKMMFKGLILTGSVLLMTACGGSDAASNPNTQQREFTPENRLSEQNMDASLWYNTSAEAHALYLQTYNYAALKLKQNLGGESADQAFAVIVDIDETVLDNSPYQLARLSAGETFSSSTWKQWVESAVAKPLPGALDFANTCKDLGVEVFYVSNRSVEMLEATMTNLKNESFPFADPDHIFLQEGGESDKSQRRLRVQEEHKVVLYLGDNLRDFQEDFTDRGDTFGKDKVELLKNELKRNFVIFPNPMYGEWTATFVRDNADDEIVVKKDMVNRILFE